MTYIMRGKDVTVLMATTAQANGLGDMTDFFGGQSGGARIGQCDIGDGQRLVGLSGQGGHLIGGRGGIAEVGTIKEG
jgi:hypothetical protein